MTFFCLKIDFSILPKRKNDFRFDGWGPASSICPSGPLLAPVRPSPPSRAPPPGAGPRAWAGDGASRTREPGSGSQGQLSWTQKAPPRCWGADRCDLDAASKARGCTFQEWFWKWLYGASDLIPKWLKKWFIWRPDTVHHKGFMTLSCQPRWRGTCCFQIDCQADLVRTW